MRSRCAIPKSNQLPGNPQPMKRIIALFLAICPGLGALGADTLYNNVNGVHTFFPPTPAPQIDAINFLNQNEFFVTNISGGGFGFPDPFSTWSTLNWTNLSFM